MMDMDTAMNADNEEQLQVEDAGDSSGFAFTEILPLNRDTDVSYVTECVCGEWSAQNEQENLVFLKEEPNQHDYESTVVSSVKNDAMRAEVGESHGHLEPVVVPETLNFAQLPKRSHIGVHSGESGVKIETDSNDVTVRSHNGKRTGDRQYSCDKCQRRFTYLRGLRKHVNVHTDKFKCRDCSKCYQSATDLASHRRSHVGDRLFECTVCSKRFTRSDHVVRHRRIHSGEEQEMYRCYVCDKPFSHCINLNRHLRVHTGEKPYLCSSCGKSFRDSSNLQKHRRGIHQAGLLSEVKTEPNDNRPTAQLHNNRKTEEKWYSCNECEKRFSYLRGLREHMNVHTDRYKCPDCGKRLTSTMDLAEHGRIHSGDKPFVCSVCGRCFARSHHLVRHGRIHSAERPYKCHACDRAFRQSTDLCRHMRVHTGEKPYSCSECGKRFSDCSNLQQHKRRVHRSV